MGDVDQDRRKIGRVGGEDGLAQDQKRHCRKRDHHQHHAVERVALRLRQAGLRGETLRRLDRHRKPRCALRVVGDDKRRLRTRRQVERCDHLRGRYRPRAEGAVFVKVEQGGDGTVFGDLVDRDLLGEIGVDEEAPGACARGGIQDRKPQPDPRRGIAEIGDGAGKRLHRGRRRVDEIGDGHLPIGVGRVFKIAAKLFGVGRPGKDERGLLGGKT